MRCDLFDFFQVQRGAGHPHRILPCWRADALSRRLLGGGGADDDVKLLRFHMIESVRFLLPACCCLVINRPRGSGGTSRRTRESAAAKRAAAVERSSTPTNHHSTDTRSKSPRPQKKAPAHAKSKTKKLRATASADAAARGATCQLVQSSAKKAARVPCCIISPHHLKNAIARFRWRCGASSCRRRPRRRPTPPRCAAAGCTWPGARCGTARPS